MVCKQDAKALTKLSLLLPVLAFIIEFANTFILEVSLLLALNTHTHTKGKEVWKDITNRPV